LRFSLQWYVCPNKFGAQGLLLTDAAANLLMFTIVALVSVGVPPPRASPPVGWACFWWVAGTF
jgi:hypothetical protein